MSNLCFLDFETTGINVFYDQPLQIGAVLVDSDLNIITEFTSFINPIIKVDISETAANIHGINYEMLEHEPTPKEVLKSYFNHVGTDYAFAAWNIGFDGTLIRKMCHENDFMNEYNKVNYRHVEVQTIAAFSRKIGKLPEDVKSLDNVSKYFGIIRSSFHNALEDAKILLHVYKSLLNLYN